MTATNQPNHTKLGILLWNQATAWPAYEAAAKRVDELGYDSPYDDETLERWITEVRPMVDRA